MCQTVSSYNPYAKTEYIYLHWPFCPYKCTFCPFVAFAGIDQYMEQYHKMLLQEIYWFKKHHQDNAKIKTIFIGGGTPSTYPDRLLLDMSDTLRDVFTLEDDFEFSIEVNPGTVRIEQLAMWKGAGINRLSIGVQSLNDKVLHKLNRKQSSKDVYFLLDNASKLFDNISVDIIVGMPGVSGQDWSELINKIIGWPVKHVSMYFLMVHENTPLYKGVKEGKVSLPIDDKVVDQYLWAVDKFKEAGFEQYEVSNFAKPGFRSEHNQAYWSREPYRGFGVGACSFDGKTRFGNDKRLLKYFKAVSADCFAANFMEELDFKQSWLEKLMLGMRQSKGVLLSDLFEGLSKEKKENFIVQLNLLHEAKFVVISNDRLYLTPKGLSVENEVVVQLSKIN